MGLDAAGVRFERDRTLVRGLDYYRHTAFEFVTDRLGAQGTVLGGGRYDGLIETLGGPNTPAVGWAAGIERLAMLVEAPISRGPWVLVVEDDDVETYATMLAQAMRLGTGQTRELLDDRSPIIVVNTGSRKKRFERAMAMEPNHVIVFDRPLIDGGLCEIRVRTPAAPGEFFWRAADQIFQLSINQHEYLARDAVVVGLKR